MMIVSQIPIRLKIIHFLIPEEMHICIYREALSSDGMQNCDSRKLRKFCWDTGYSDFHRTTSSKS